MAGDTAFAVLPCFELEWRNSMNETGYETFSFYYDTLTANVNYAARAAYFDLMIQTYLHSTGKVLLDLACGTGSLSEKMCRYGYDVIGVDYSCGMLNQAMEKKLEQNLPIQYVQQDMRQLELYGTIDVTLCALDSLNHLPTFSDVQEVFRRVAKATEPGGLFLFDMNTLYKHQNILGNHIYIYETEDVYCIWENTLREDQCTVDITLQLFHQCEDGRYIRSEEQIIERAYPTEQIKAALETVGFQVLKFFHADTAEELREDSERMVVIARKES